MTNDQQPTAVPKLRFPEFQETGWAEEKIGALTFPISEKNKSDEKLPVYSISNVDGFVPQSKQFEGVDSYQRGYDTTLYKIVENNTFAYNPARINVGSIGYSGDLNRVLISSLYVCFKTKDRLDDQFFWYVLKSKLFNQAVNNAAEGGIRSYLFYENLATIKIAIPSLPEQQKIAATLSALDALIATQGTKLAALQAHTRGLMQELFPAEGEKVPKRRFPEFRNAEEWEESQLDAEGIAAFVNDKVSLRGLKPGSYVSTENLLPSYGGVVPATSLPASGSFTKFQKNDILVSNIRPYLRKIWRATMDGAASNDVIVIRAGASIDSSFLGFLLKSDKFINYVMRSAGGVKMPRGDKGEIKQYPVACPMPAEQQKIAAVLSSLDDLITAQRDKIDALKQHKKGLMQGLFPAASTTI
jgi:type I restriction enzyme S subunit